MTVQTSTPGGLHINPYEKRWIKLSIILLLFFALAVGVSAFAFGYQVPIPEQRVNPMKITASGPFAHPGLRELAPGKYEAYILAHIWAFTPNEMHVPVGSRVTFYVTSRDVQHGFLLQGTNVNAQVIPGYVSTLSYHFTKPGTYTFVCNEYCGLGHQSMYGRIIVEPR